MHHKPILLQQVSQIINQLRKHPYNKNKDLALNFEIPPADHLTRDFIVNPSRG